MQVIFERVDDRRYRIGAIRNGRRDVGADIEPRPGPGHADVPHDLVHFVVEEQAGLTLGIYGQLAAGGDVHGFFVPAPAERSKARDRKRSSRIWSAGRGDVEVSERLAALVGPGGRLLPDTGTDAVSPALRTAIERRLADVLGRWQRTPPGGRLVLDWPEALTARPGAPGR